MSFTITTPNDLLSQKIEPNAPSSSLRFKSIYNLSKNNIYCGLTLMPILPIINDKKEDIIKIVEQAADCGAKYIIASFGLTQREGQREYFYKKLDQHFPNIKTKYQNYFKNNYICNSPNSEEL